ncbi:MAG: sigma-70 family RNA polymerase sigma factor [Pirellulales bacterium]
MFPPATAVEWIAIQEAVDPASAAQRHAAWVERFGGLLRELSNGVCDQWPPDESQFVHYGRRVWMCLEHHWRRMAAIAPLTFDEVCARFERGDIGVRVGEVNLLAEVMLAQALEFKQAKAALMFETQYMPDVRRIARRSGGERAADSVENLAADLILPREQKRGGELAPRIASYQGRTSLRSWLRTVVVHRWISTARKAPHLAIAQADDVADPRAAAAPGINECEELLRPIFTQAVNSIDAEDRLLIKMLVLDNVQQASLAQSLGVHTGNVTRRRQRALEQILLHASSAGRRDGSSRFDDCLETILTGGDRDLRQSLAGALAGALQPESKRAGEGVEP